MHSDIDFPLALSATSDAAAAPEPGWRDSSAVLARTLAPVAIAGAGGWLAFQCDVLQYVFQVSTTQEFLAGAFLLAIAWRMVASRRQAGLVMLAWYLGAAASMPSEWVSFFGGGHLGGFVVWGAWAALMALPYTIFPRRLPAVGLVSGLALTAIPPLGFIGLGSPLIASGALFAGLGWAGLICTFAFYALATVPGRWPVVLLTAVILTATVRNVEPPPTPPATSWAMTTFDGTYPHDLMSQFQRQDALKTRVEQDIRQGAKLIILPEGAIDNWTDGNSVYWSDVSALAKAHHAQVLVGVYRSTDDSMRNAADGLLDLTTGVLYPATISIPFGMWHPWRSSADDPNFPIQFGALLKTIPTRFGPAAYSICYEELLLWPLAAKMATDHPKLIISAANQWFTTPDTARAQTRSIAMQARLWGLPVLRAVNWAPMR